MTLDPVPVLVARLLLAAVFATAAVGKLRRREAFEGIVANYRLLPERLALPFARALPFVELATVVLLIVPTTARAGGLLAAGLLLLFAGAMTVNILRGRTDIDCGCFVGFLRQRIGWPLVARNLVLALAAVLPWLPVAPRPLGPFDLFTVAAAVVVLTASHAALSRLLELPAPGERR